MKVACKYCGKQWEASRVYPVRDKPLGKIIGWRCQDYSACHYREKQGYVRTQSAPRT
jgi:hypothetical protein